MYQDSPRREGEKSSGNVTVRDVAERAGVSPTVVSRVLHNKANAIRVSEATAERVRRAAEELGYRRNVLATLFRERQTMMIGVLHGMGFGKPLFSGTSQYFSCLMDGIVDGAFSHGYSVTLCPQLYGSTPEDAMADGRFDGLVWYSTHLTGGNRELLEKCSVPLVLIHTPASEFGNKFPAVICDNHQGIGIALDKLAELGHTRIAFALENEYPSVEGVFRRDAFIEIMEQRGLSVDDSDIIDIRADLTGLHMYFASGVRHTAIIGANDDVGSKVIALAHQYGVNVPGQLSVVGFDSTSYCDQVQPGLSSIHQPLVVMGRSAVSLLVRSISGEMPDPPTLVFPCGLDIRGSTTSART
ncbi:MAG: LacI family DNA-binding transcriptional regulator [Armatimonadetes bacterium]|nr:LacI family DNA-binding transcriptional regulator [Armatimonadota bacterium]